MAYGDEFTPTKLGKGDPGHITIDWADGESFRYKMDWLRSKCPCAGCIDEWTHEVLVRYEDVIGVGVKKLEQVGNYAFSIHFSDGHATGIFTFKFLRKLGAEGGGVEAEA